MPPKGWKSIILKEDVYRRLESRKGKMPISDFINELLDTLDRPKEEPTVFEIESGETAQRKLLQSLWISKKCPNQSFVNLDNQWYCVDFTKLPPRKTKTTFEACRLCIITRMPKTKTETKTDNKIYCKQLTRWITPKTCQSIQQQEPLKCQECTYK
jgi:predicted CopG family antitoxin